MVDKISDQLNLIIKSLQSIEERVTKGEERISKLNMLIYKRLIEKKNLKKKVLDLKPLEEQDFKATMKMEKVLTVSD